ncbi:hypothetical protein [Sinisalibacter aestuarii]|uniref:Lysozyme inhibitor n=1 Tax=Sinisalibacter aestuarii TaxID=2949426 RepID=A0ABQ5LX58_9RHOB|nr:hypothetical protein [Sinisalibacter aestuarii]GKY89566.1 hypothetical protein STA1M1_34350 [Sinisalibacter aestuarii]
MTYLRKTSCAAFLGLAALVLPNAASAEIITANCTGMFDLNIYEMDTTLASQEVEKIGVAQFTVDDDFIVLTGDFGEYRFDLNAGTLYHNGSDTGLYCTYSRKPA